MMRFKKLIKYKRALVPKGQKKITNLFLKNLSNSWRNYSWKKKRSSKKKKKRIRKNYSTTIILKKSVKEKAFLSNIFSIQRTALQPNQANKKMLPKQLIIYIFRISAKVRNL